MDEVINYAEVPLPILRQWQERFEELGMDDLAEEIHEYVEAYGEEYE